MARVSQQATAITLYNYITFWATAVQVVAHFLRSAGLSGKQMIVVLALYANYPPTR